MSMKSIENVDKHQIFKIILQSETDETIYSSESISEKGTVNK